MRIPEELVERAVRTGEREALAALVAAAQGDIFHLLLSRLGDTTEAEDATQETFRQVLESLRTLREPRAFPGWIYRIALDKARQARRARAAEKRTLSALAARTSASGEDAMHPAEQAEIREKVREAVKGLDDDLRTAVELRYEHDLSYAEIAEATDVPEGTVARRLHTAHDRLQKALAGAGVAIAFAALERELSAAPRAEVPRHVARWLERMATDGGSAAAIPRRSGVRFRAMASAAALLLGISAVVLWRLNREGTTGESSADAPKSSGVSAGGPEGRRDSRLPAEDTASAANVARPPEGRVLLTGRVRDRLTGAPIPGAQVFAKAPDDDARARRNPFTQADDAGRFQIEVVPGDWLLLASAPGYVDLGTEAAVGIGDNRPGSFVPLAGLTPDGFPVRAAAGLPAEIELSLHPGAALEGTVADSEGRPIEGARVSLGGQGVPVGDQTSVLLPCDGEEADGSVLTGATGAFRMAGLWPAGNITLTVVADGYVKERVRADVEAPSTRLLVTLRRAMRIVGSVLDEAARPLSGVRIYGEDWSRSLQEAARTGDDGRFELRSAPQDARLILAWAPGHGCVVAAAPWEGDGLALVLPAARETLRGTVVDAAGAPVGGAEVVAFKLSAQAAGLKGSLLFDSGPSFIDTEENEWSASAPSGTPTPSATTDAAGKFEFAGFALGSGSSVTLLVRRNGYREEIRTVASPEWLGITLIPRPAGK